MEDNGTKRKKSTNPLYVVRNNGVDVEEAGNLFELLLKKTGLDKIVPMLEMLVQVFLAEVKSYAVFMEVKKVIDKLVEKIVEVLFQIQQLSAKKH